MHKYAFYDVRDRRLGDFKRQMNFHIDLANIVCVSIYIYIYMHVCMYTHTVKYYSAIKNVIFGNMDWLDLKGIILSEINQRKINTVLSHFYADHKK